MATAYHRNSFLIGAQLRDDTFLGLNNLPQIGTSIYDETYIIGQEYDERPDLLASKLYNSSRLWWVFSMRNPDHLKDPIRDFKAGLEIRLPAAERVKRATGGS